MPRERIKAVVFVEIDIEIETGADAELRRERLGEAIEWAARRDAGVRGVGPSYRWSRVERGDIPKPILVGTAAEAVLAVAEGMTPDLAVDFVSGGANDDERAAVNVSAVAIAEVARLATGGL